MAEGMRELSEDFVIRALTPFMRAPPPWPNHKGPTFKHCNSGDYVSTCEFLWGHTYSVYSRYMLLSKLIKVHTLIIRGFLSVKKHFCKGNDFTLLIVRESMHERLVQDGRVEGCVLTPSCESSGITTNCWTLIDRKTLELTKKDTPHPKTKEKPQWDGRRGAITIKSNLITTGWVTHKLENNYTTGDHPLEWRFWAPRQASQPGGPAMGGGIPRESDFEG